MPSPLDLWHGQIAATADWRARLIATAPTRLTVFDSPAFGGSYIQFKLIFIIPISSLMDRFY